VYRNEEMMAPLPPLSKLSNESRPASPQTRIINDYKPLDNGIPYKAEKVILDPYDLESINIGKRLTPEQRYWYYIKKGIPDDSITPMEDNTIAAVEEHIPVILRKSDLLQSKRLEMIKEIEQEYNIALKQSIINYILLDSRERERLCIPPLPPPYIPRTARAPVPWHDEVVQVKQRVSDNLFITNPVMVELLKIYSQFENMRIVDMSVLTQSVLPMGIEEYQAILKNQCQQFKSRLINE
jgi:dynein heavy chain, axonemal